MIEQKIITYNHRRFEVLLDYSKLSVSEHDFDLTIVLKICLVQNGGMTLYPGVCQYYGDQSPSEDELLLEQVAGTQADYDGRLFLIEDWDTKEWIEFCNFYRDESTLFWNNRFSLSSQQSVTSSSSDDDASKYYLSPGKQITTFLSPINTVNCKFRLELTSIPSKAHKIINVYKISSLERTHTFRPDDGHYKASDLEAQKFQIVDSDPMLSQKFSYQRTFIHEVGHAIGLDHVGIQLKIPGCSQSDDGAHICYGNTLTTSMSVMGRGETLSFHESLPWCAALAKLTNTKLDSWYAKVNSLTY